jgi:DNA-binding NtrC family response regulator
VRNELRVVLRIDEHGQLALVELSRLLVGQVDLKEAQRALRKCMSQEALARCNGSRSAAAALLGIDRRYVQRLANEGDLCASDIEHAGGPVARLT